MYINSPRSVYAGLAIYDTMQYIKPKLYAETICVGVAMSMGALLLAGGAAGKRMALPNSKILIHQVSGGFSGAGNRHRDPRQGDHRRPRPPRRDHRQAHRPGPREGREGHRSRLLHERGRGEGVLDRRPRHRAPTRTFSPPFLDTGRAARAGTIQLATDPQRASGPAAALQPPVTLPTGSTLVITSPLPLNSPSRFEPGRSRRSASGPSSRPAPTVQVGADAVGYEKNRTRLCPAVRFAA